MIKKTKGFKVQSVFVNVREPPDVSHLQLLIELQIILFFLYELLMIFMIFFIFFQTVGRHVKYIFLTPIFHM